MLTLRAEPHRDDAHAERRARRCRDASDHDVYAPARESAARSAARRYAHDAMTTLMLPR